MINRKLIILGLKKILLTYTATMPQWCLTRPHTSTPRTYTIFRSMRTSDTPFTVRIWVFIAKSWCNFNTCFYKHLWRHTWGWGQYCMLKATLLWSWLHFSTSLDHQAVHSAAACFCVLKHLQPAQQTGWLPSVEKTPLPEIQSKMLFHPLKNNSFFPKGRKKKKTQQNYFLNYSHKVSETYLAWKSQESLLSPALWVNCSSHTKTWATKMGKPISNLCEILCL